MYLMNETSNRQNEFEPIRAEFQLFLQKISSPNPFDIIITSDSNNERPICTVVSLQNIIDLKIEQLDSNQLSDEDVENFVKLVDYFALISKALQKALIRGKNLHEKDDERDSTLW